jgi:hypothetical protein
MLVKFISFVITLFGTKRYKPVLFASLALVATMVGVNTVFSLYREQPHSAASSINQDEAGQNTSQGLSAQGLQKQSPAEVNEQTSTAPTANTDQNTQGNPPATPSSNAPSITTSLADATITLKREANSTITSQPITFSSSDGSKLQWQVDTPQNAAGQPVNNLSVTTSGDRSGSSTISLTLRGDSTLQLGQYSVTIHAKDSGRGTDLTKTIIITIAE